MNIEQIYRRLAVLVMFTAFFGQTFYTSFIVADYYTNTQAFAKNCENIARPELHCNGKCQMIKKIKSEEKKEQQNPERRDNKNEIVLYITSPDLIRHSFTYKQRVTAYSFLSDNKEIKMPRSLLRPPIA